MKKLKAVSQDSGKQPVYNLHATASNVDWILAGRLREKADAGDKQAKKELEKMDNQEMVFFTFDDLENIRRIVEMENEERI